LWAFQSWPAWLWLPHGAARWPAVAGRGAEVVAGVPGVINASD